MAELQEIPQKLVLSRDEGIVKKRVKRPIASLPALEHAKLPPQALDLEEAVLGALMLEKDALTAVIDKLQPESFYKEPHQKIFSAIQTLFQKNAPVDSITVINELKSTGDLDIVGGAFYLTQLTNRIASTANTEYHAHIIIQKYFMRELIRLNNEIVNDAYEDTTDVFDLIGKYYDKMSFLLQSNFPTKEKSTTELFKEFTDRTEQAAKSKNEGKVIGVPSDLKALDQITGGWQPSNLIIVAARPGMGKTAFMKACTRKAVTQLQKPILIFSLEMSSYQLTARIVSEEINIPAQNFLKGDIPADFKEKVDGAIKKYYSNDGKDLLIIDDTPALSISQMTHRAKKIMTDHDISMILVDYIQLAGKDKTVHSNNREQDISAISRGLKALAKELKIPVIALSQLNREVEKRGGKMIPKLSDLRESGAIEQDADIVIFLHRPRYYYDLGHENMKTIKINDIEIDSEGYAQFIIAKNRNGATGWIHAKFINYLTKFEDWEDTDGVIDFSKSSDNRDDLPF